MVKTTFRKHLYIIMSLVIAIGCLFGNSYIPRAFAEETIFPTRYSGESTISGQNMVWLDNNQITVQHIVTGEKQQITTTPKHKRSAFISGTLVVWLEKADSQFDFNVYAYDLSTGAEKKLTDTPGPLSAPSTDGEFIVWETGGSLFAYEWATGTVSPIGSGREPIIDNGNVLFKSGGKLNLYDLKSGVIKLEIAPPGGYTFNSFVEFKGNTALYYVSKNDKGRQLALLQLGGTSPKIQYLTPFNNSTRFYAQLAVGDNYVAWVNEDKNGIHQLMGARIDDGTTMQLTQSEEQLIPALPIAFIGDTLIWLDGVTMKAMPLQIEKSVDGPTNFKPDPPPSPAPVAINRPEFPELDKSLAPLAPLRKSDAKRVKVYADGQNVTFEEQPFIENGSTLVQFRPIFEKLGLGIKWDAETRTVTGSKDGVTIQLQIDEPRAIVNGVVITLEAAPKIKNDVTMVPLRLVGEATGRKVIWNNELRKVYIIDPSSEGKLYYSNGTLRYEGQLHDGKMHGKGKLYREDGSLWYDAEFVNNEIEEEGKFIQKGFVEGNDMTDYYYVGEIKDGIPEGQGAGYDPSGEMIYEGSFKNGKYDGIGRFYVKGMLLYEGEFAKNKYDGSGKLYSQGRLLYEGGFKENNRHGKGKLYDNTRFKILEYEGEFVNDKFEGYGIHYFKDYIGEWKNGEKHGKGQDYRRYLEYEGVFVGGVREGYGRLFISDRQIYEGMFINGVPEGTGKLMDYYGKITYEGQFKDGKPLGN
ncbi:hypothetical protein QFZ81_000810 [Paenibacillus sp. V4I9]|uniref:stalk domain-containing protein n=1 Tax=Paenibacillus sp. V4I9 TaxID=3042308 RepID=UPI00278A48F7|nr:stalk domain-containing protein [Paenibacillus sp. V4I9]MDQ0885722.1 hypothetical protein [Paenibacillus sp. V4I9]